MGFAFLCFSSFFSSESLTMQPTPRAGTTFLNPTLFFFSFFSFSFLPLDLSEVFGGFPSFFFLSFSRNGFGGLVGIRKEGRDGRKEL